MKQRLLFWTAIIISLTAGNSVWAGQGGSRGDYVVYPDGGRYIFVMLSSGVGKHDETIRAFYSQSGLYDRSDISEPLYTLDWYAEDVSVSSDGNYLVRWEIFPFIKGYDEVAFTIYEMDSMLADYQFNQLMAEPEKLIEEAGEMAILTSLYWRAEARIDNQKRQLYLRTRHDEEFYFDLTTGTLIEGPLIKNPPLVLDPPIIALIMLLIIFGFGLLIIYFLKFLNTSSIKTK
jgi:hypothetical protein